MIFPWGGRVQDDILGAGCAHYSPPMTPKTPLWDMTHEMLGIVFCKLALRVTYIGLVEPTECRNVVARLFYHTSLPAGETCRGLLRLLEDEADNPDGERLQASLVQALLEKVLEEVENDMPSAKGKQLLTWQQLSSYVEMNFQQFLSRGDLAAHFRLNASYVSQLFQKNSGLSYCEYLRTLRLNHARRLLQASDYSIDEITAQCGYISSTSFITAFRKRYGVSPGRYRSHHRAIPEAVKESPARKEKQT